MLRRMGRLLLWHPLNSWPTNKFLCWNGQQWSAVFNDGPVCIVHLLFFCFTLMHLYCAIGIKLYKCRDHISSSSHYFSLLLNFILNYLFTEWIFSCPFLILQRIVDQILRKILLSCLGDIQIPSQKKYLSAIQKIIQIFCCTQKPWK